MVGYTVFFINGTATTEIYTLSLHDALPIYHRSGHAGGMQQGTCRGETPVLSIIYVSSPGAPRPIAHGRRHLRADRKSTRLNSSHANISYAVFCLKKKK